MGQVQVLTRTRVQLGAAQDAARSKDPGKPQILDSGDVEW